MTMNSTHSSLQQTTEMECLAQMAKLVSLGNSITQAHGQFLDLAFFQGFDTREAMPAVREALRQGCFPFTQEGEIACHGK